MNKRLLIITSLLILLPMILGIVVWNSLPDTMAIHWNINNEPDSYASKAFVVFGLPLLLLGIHLLCSFVTNFEPKKENHSKAMLNIMLLIVPTISLLCSFVVYGTALSIAINISLLATILMGITFVILGCFMPTCKQNYTIGIKLPWTLANEDNWNKTHKFAGKLWVVAGILMLVYSILGLFSASLGIMIGAVLIPIIYSYKISK